MSRGEPYYYRKRTLRYNNYNYNNSRSRTRDRDGEHDRINRYHYRRRDRYSSDFESDYFYHHSRKHYKPSSYNYYHTTNYNNNNYYDYYTTKYNNYNNYNTKYSSNNTNHSRYNKYYNNNNNNNDNSLSTKYTSISKKKSKPKQSKNKNKKNNDLKGQVSFQIGDKLYNRYKIISKLGQGTFGCVVECYDEKRNMNVAVKIIRSVKKYLDQAIDEIEIIEKLNQFDIYNNSLIIKMYKSFNTIINEKKHACIVFEKCGPSIYEIIKKNKYEGFDKLTIGMVSYQIFHAIEFCHNNELTHTDLKLENVLFLYNEKLFIKRKNNNNIYINTPKNPLIRLIDFGGATWNNSYHSSIINTRQYRSPEVILGLSWDNSSDLWSIGCMLSEMITGDLLFGTHEDIEHLALMNKILNKEYPKEMITKALKKYKNNTHKSRRSPDSGITIDEMFDENTKKLSWPQKASNKESLKYVEKTKKLTQLIKDSDLCHLIEQCLQFNPKNRITCTQAKQHKYFDQFKSHPLFIDMLQKLEYNDS